MLKLIIAGGRDFSNYCLLKKVVDNFVAMHPDQNIEIVSGRAHGADSLGEKYAKESNLSVAYFPANWDQYGKSAGFRRNYEMGQYADEAICFWDGQSKGTDSMIQIMRRQGKQVTVVKYTSQERR